MRMQKNKKVHFESGPNMTPMVDVVMVLLIFFMLGASFVGMEHFLTSNLSITSKASGPASDSKVIPDEPVVIQVNPAVSGFVATAGQITSSDPEDLWRKLEGMRLGLNQAGKANERLQVVISPMGNSQYQHLLQVQEAANRAGFTKIAFSTAR